APGGFALPHVKLYGRDGTLMWERSEPPVQLIADLETAIAPRAKPAIDPRARRIEIVVTDAGFEPARIEVATGEAVTLVFTRTSDHTCATDVHFTAPDSRQVDERLPLGAPVAIPFHAARAAAVTFP